MSDTKYETILQPDGFHTDRTKSGPVRVARIAGLFYLTMAIGGGFTFAVSQFVFYSPGDAEQTAANLLANETLARILIAAALLAVVGQTGTVLYLFRLFRPFDQFSATATMMFGFMNSGAGLVGATFWAAALKATIRDGGPGSSDTILVLFELSQAALELSYLGWGLWLLPMGWLAWRTGAMPKLLGQTLIVGAFGYIVSAFVGQLFEGSTAVVETLQIPAHIGEFWMIGYLLFIGVRVDKGSIFNQRSE